MMHGVFRGGWGLLGEQTLGLGVKEVEVGVVVVFEVRGGRDVS